MAITTFKRYEKKIMVNKEQYELLVSRLLEYMDLDEHCSGGKMYTIYNIYYDTINDDIINKSLAKPYYKEKLRLRSYKPVSDKNDKVFLELKKKIKGIVSKRRVVLTLDEVDKFLKLGQRPNKKDYISEQVINEIEYFLSKNDVHPAVVINYKRMAFFGKEDRDFRVTFDESIKTRRNNFYLGACDLGKYILDEGSKLLEIKILGAIPLWFTNILSELELYPRGFSKYGSEFEHYCKSEKYEMERGNAVC